MTLNWTEIFHEAFNPIIVRFKLELQAYWQFRDNTFNPIIVRFKLGLLEKLLLGPLAFNPIIVRFKLWEAPEAETWTYDLSIL